MMLVFFGISVAVVVSLGGCRGTKTVRNEVSQISLKVKFEEAPPMGVVMTDQNFLITFQFPPSITDATKDKVASVVQKFDFEGLDKTTRESLLADLAETKSDKPLEQCPNLKVTVGDAELTQDEKGWIGINLNIQGKPTISALATVDKGKAVHCVATFKTNPAIIKKYRDLYPKFITAMGGKLEAAPASSTQSSLVPDSK